MLGVAAGDGRGSGKAVRCLVAAALLVSAEAGAIVTQPGSQVALPRPVDQGEWLLVTQSWAFNRDVQVNRDFDGMDVNQENLHYRDFYPTFEDGDAITLEGMFKWQGEAIDSTLDATSAPGAFVPHCALSVELLLAGSTCEPALYWYNLPTLTGGPPELDELNQIIPWNLVTYLSCVPPFDAGFCPLAWDNRNPRELDKQLWERKTVTLDLSGDVNYQGGAIGFVILVTPSTTTGCANNIHSVQEHNQRDAMDRPLVGALMYQSVLDPEAVYLAFEERLGVSATYHDFNDYVVRASGCFEDLDGAGGSGGPGAGGASGTEGGAPQAGQAGASSEPEPSTGGVGTAGSPASDAGAPAGNVGGAPSSGGQPGAEPPVSSGGVGGDDATPGPASSSESSGCGCRWPRQRGHESGAFLLALVAAATLRARRRLRRAV